MTDEHIEALSQRIELSVERLEEMIAKTERAIEKMHDASSHDRELCTARHAVVAKEISDVEKVFAGMRGEQRGELKTWGVIMGVVTLVISAIGVFFGIMLGK